MRREESEVKGGLGLKAPTLARHRVREVEHRGVQIEGRRRRLRRDPVEAVVGVFPVWLAPVMSVIMAVFLS